MGQRRLALLNLVAPSLFDGAAISLSQSRVPRPDSELLVLGLHHHHSPTSIITRALTRPYTARLRASMVPVCRQLVLAVPAMVPE